MGDIITPVVVGTIMLAVGAVAGWLGKRITVKSKTDSEVEDIHHLCEVRGEEIAMLREGLDTILRIVELLKEAQRKTIKRGLYQDYNHYKEKGKLPIYALESMKERHTSYKALGGNGAMDHLMDELMRLPRE